MKTLLLLTTISVSFACDYKDIAEWKREIRWQKLVVKKIENLGEDSPLYHHKRKYKEMHNKEIRRHTHKIIKEQARCEFFKAEK